MLDKIDKISYPLSDDNYIKNVFEKKQIVVGHTFTNDMSHIIGWENRYNGSYKKTAAFTIDLDGKIYQHFDPKYYSNFLNIQTIDENVISIALVNEGWLIRDLKEDEYTDFLNNSFDREIPIKKKWRNHTYWAKYSDEQINALIELCEYLSNEYNIKLKTIGHNTRVDGVYDFEGVVFRSNFIKEYTDISPAFDFVEFKNKLELKTKNDER